MEFKRIEEEIDKLESYKSNGILSVKGSELLAELKQALQLQQTGISGSNCCKQCKKEIDSQFRFCSPECKQYYYR